MHSHDSIAVSGTSTLGVEKFLSRFSLYTLISPTVNQQNLGAYLSVEEVNMKRKPIQNLSLFGFLDGHGPARGTGSVGQMHRLIILH